MGRARVKPALRVLSVLAYVYIGINVGPDGLELPRMGSVDLAAGSTAPMYLPLKRHKSAHFQSFLRCQFQA